MMVTRKLRRRHYDPMPIPERKRKPIPSIHSVRVRWEGVCGSDVGGGGGEEGEEQ